MKITLQAVRVYGSSSCYGPSSDPWHRDEPSILGDFPSKGERSVIWLGIVPTSISLGVRLRPALATMMLQAFAGRSPSDPAELEDHIESFLNDGQNAMFPANMKWFVTIAVERDVNIDDIVISKSQYVWIDPEFARPIDSDFVRYATPHLDQLATYISTSVEPMFFENVLVEDRVFFIAADRKPFSLPKLVGRASAPDLSNLTLDIEQFDQTLRAVASLPKQQHLWLTNLSHWYLRTVREGSPWERFVWRFIALEILINKLWKGFYDGVVDSLAIRDDDHDGPNAAVNAVVWPRDASRTPLKARFAIVALALSPETASDDVKVLERIKASRDQLSHGELIDETRLPHNECRALLNRYLDLAIQSRLGIDRLPANE